MNTDEDRFQLLLQSIDKYRDEIRDYPNENLIPAYSSAFFRARIFSDNTKKTFFKVKISRGASSRNYYVANSNVDYYYSNHDSWEPIIKATETIEESYTQVIDAVMEILKEEKHQVSFKLLNYF